MDTSQALEKVYDSKVKMGTARRRSQHPRQQSLQELLRRGLNVVEKPKMFTGYKAKDWVTTVYADDIDGDGDTEILFGSRDGFVRALTKNGDPKWKRQLHSWVTTVISIPPVEHTHGDIPHITDNEQKVHNAAEADELLQTSDFDNKDDKQKIRVVAGTRDGKVYFLNQKGKIQGFYQANQVIRQVYVHPEHPTHVIVGSEDNTVYLIEIETRKVCWQYKTNGWIMSVLACDIDGDQQLEVLAASADKHIYVFDFNGSGTPRFDFKTEHKVYALRATTFERGGPLRLLTSSNNKDLSCWEMLLSVHEEDGESKKETGELRPIWPTTPHFANRIHSICVVDINSDSQHEIIAGSEDKHLYILNAQGKLLWKYDVGYPVYSVFAEDIDKNDIIEILVGLEDTSIRVLQVQLIPDLLENIIAAHDRYRKGKLSIEHITSDEQLRQVRQKFSLQENALLDDLLPMPVPTARTRLELEIARTDVKRRNWLEALPTLLRLRQQHVQSYWSTIGTGYGHLRAACLGDVAKDSIDELIIGTDEGEIIAVDIETEKELWRKQVESRVWMLQMGTAKVGYYDTILACLAERKLLTVDHTGEVVSTKPELEIQDRVLSVYINKQGTHPDYTMTEIILGLENRKVYIYDSLLNERLLEITTPPDEKDKHYGIKKVCTHDLTGNKDAEIICSGTNNHVYVYTRQGDLLWEYVASDRVEALCVEDIDCDSQAEVIVGSEDRYVYVLDAEGRLKWHYRMPHRVLDIAVADIDNDNCSELLVGAADGYMYALSKDGDLLWKFQANDRVRIILARDMNDDKHVEIAVGSDDQLQLLQVVNKEEVQKLLSECIKRLSLDAIGDTNKVIRKLVASSDDYVRAYSYSYLSGVKELTDDDLALLDKAFDDKAYEVRKELPAIIVSLCRINQNKINNITRTRKRLQKVLDDPDHEVRLSLVKLLPRIAEIDSKLCFEFLEGFAKSTDVWLCHALVRELYQLAEKHGKQTYRLLLELASNDDEWIAQEAGRILAHYFDIHTENLISGLYGLLQRKEIKVRVYKQIEITARSGEHPVVHQVFLTLIELLKEPEEKYITKILTDAIATLQEIVQQQVPHAEGTLQVYQEYLQLFEATTLEDIEQYQHVSDLTHAKEEIGFQTTVQIFDLLYKVVEKVRLYGTRQTFADRMGSFYDAQEQLDAIGKQVHELSKLQILEQHIFSLVVTRWNKALQIEKHHIRGRAVLLAELKQKNFPRDTEIVVSLFIKNEGDCAADDVQITLKEDEQHFSVVGAHKKTIKQIPNGANVDVLYTIRPCTAKTKLIFTITFDDSQKKEKSQSFTGEIQWYTEKLPFTRIISPYTTGTPIHDRDKDIFFGRKESLAYLYNLLSNTKSNMIVVLMGQRRAGKSSLMYRLERDMLQAATYFPLFINLHTDAMATNYAQLLYKIALHIHETLQEREYNLTLPPDFLSQPTISFELFLKQVLRIAPQGGIVLLFDEFELLEGKIREGQLSEDFLRYLRGLIHDLPGINYILAGTPRIKEMTTGYWSTFFNIARYHEISALDTAAARDLIIKPVPELRYDSYAVAKIQQLTGNWPYFIHILCGDIVRYCNSVEDRYVTLNTVNEAAKLVLKTGSSHFDYIWKETTFVEKFLLSILAQNEDDEQYTFSLAAIKQIYYDLGQSYRYNEQEVFKALQHLRQNEVIEMLMDESLFRIATGLVKDWLHQQWPTKKVLRLESYVNTD